MLKLMLHQKCVGDTRLFYKSLRWKHSSSEVRSQFLEFFQNNGHKFVAGSPVVPMNDPSLMFVNAGMNQFKSILQNEVEAISPRVVNSQPCIRVGGKHNDLTQVGSDGSHLTLFEMLGSWSFKDYWKSEACSMAWQLLTEHYRLDKSRLYVTYFGGCDKSGIPPDLEVRDIWLSLGVDPTHILPFDMADNFWEMGATGPCGPSTEIHYDFCGRGAGLVNAGTSGNIEIWNLVFVQYNRLASGDLDQLSSGCHIDTGMGLERLVALLNNSNSSYDSDLFQPLFKKISQHCGTPPYAGEFGSKAELDTAYRILADHIRMITVCLGDQVFPDQNHKLKFVLRKCFKLANTTFKCQPGFLQDLSKYVIQSLGDAYPLLHRREDAIKTILQFEDESYKKLMLKNEKSYKHLEEKYPRECELIELSEATSFYESLRLLDKEKVQDNLGSKLAYKLYESHGMQIGDIVKLANIRNIQFNQDEFDDYFSVKKEESKLGTSQAINMRSIITDSSCIPVTDDQAKYSYQRLDQCNYNFPDIQAKVVKIVADGRFEDCLRQGDSGIIFLDKTNFYSEAGGQIGDIGTIKTDTGSFTVTNTQPVPASQNIVAHIGTVDAGYVTVDEQVTVSIDAQHRLRCMQNHTATHVLNYVLNSLLPVTAQKSSLVTDKYLRFDFLVYNIETDKEFLRKVEDEVLAVITSSTPVYSTVVKNTTLSSVDNLVTVPGEVYPEDVTLINVMGERHVEPCCGTHLHNTADINNFVIVGFKTASSGVKTIKCLTGDMAKQARQFGVQVCEELLSYQEEIERNLSDLDSEGIEQVNKKLSQWKSLVADSKFPMIMGMELLELLTDYNERIKLATRPSSKSVKEQLKQTLEQQKDSPFLVHVVTLPDKKVSLNRLCKSVGKPCLLIAFQKNDVLAKAIVPQHLISQDFNANVWLSPVARYLGGVCVATRGQNVHQNCNVQHHKKATDPLVQDGLQQILDEVKQFANKHLE